MTVPEELLVELLAVAPPAPEELLPVAPPVPLELPVLDAVALDEAVLDEAVLDAVVLDDAPPVPVLPPVVLDEPHAPTSESPKTAARPAPSQPRITRRIAHLESEFSR
jgi:hypothetical protein